MPPKMKMKITINLGASAAAAAQPPEAAIPLASTAETVSVIKRERDECDSDELELSAKRLKQDHPLILAKQESSDDDAPMAVKPLMREQPWLSDAFALLDVMDAKDELRFFCGDSGLQGVSISHVRAQLKEARYDSFEDFLKSLRLVYTRAEEYGGDVYKQSLKLLEILDKIIMHLISSSVALKQESDHMSASGFEVDPSGSEGDASDAPSDADEDFQEQKQNEIDWAQLSDDDEEDLPRARSCSAFRDKYENHVDHAQRPFWVCLMVRLLFVGLFFVSDWFYIGFCILKDDFFSKVASCVVFLS
jgi:hypothetical protein